MFSFHSRKLVSLSLAPTRSEDVVETEESDMMRMKERRRRCGSDGRGRRQGLRCQREGEERGSSESVVNVTTGP
jgi:hypothetical protein